MKKMNKKGFTIIELVIVIAVIGILMAVLIPTFTSVVNKANKSAADQEARAALTAVLVEQDGTVNEDETIIIYKKGDLVYTYKLTNGEFGDATLPLVATKTYTITADVATTVYAKDDASLLGGFVVADATDETNDPDKWISTVKENPDISANVIVITGGVASVSGETIVFTPSAS
ncbi:MAG: type IV pilin protein [Christensenellaceae bacterium]